MAKPLRLITWNIQWGLGVDGRVDLARIVADARAIADFDLLCLQEISDNFGVLAGNDGANQFATLAALLPDHAAVEGVAVDRHTPGVGRQRFGNLLFSRLPVSQVLRHQLPWPAQPEKPTMARMALEAIVHLPDGPLRVTTTHLEVHSVEQRAAQLARLREIQHDASGHARHRVHAHKEGSPFQSIARSGRGILTGDFNCLPDEAALAALQADQPDGSPVYRDCWPLAHGTIPHPPTADLHAGDTPRCLDYVLVSSDLSGRVRRVEVDTTTRASDHQPVLLEIET